MHRDLVLHISQFGLGDWAEDAPGPKTDFDLFHKSVINPELNFTGK